MYELYYPELLAAFTGNLVADTLMFPLETVLHRLCLQGTRTIIDDTDTGLGVVPITTRYEGVTDCFHSILVEEGLSGLYKGFGALVLQYLLHMALLRVMKMAFNVFSRDRRNQSSQMLLEEWSRPSSRGSVHDGATASTSGGLPFK